MDGLILVVNGIDEVGEAEALEVGSVAGGEFGNAMMAKGQGDTGVEDASTNDGGLMFHTIAILRVWRSASSDSRTRHSATRPLSSL